MFKVEKKLKCGLDLLTCLLADLEELIIDYYIQIFCRYTGFAVQRAVHTTIEYGNDDKIFNVEVYVLYISVFLEISSIYIV